MGQLKVVVALVALASAFPVVAAHYDPITPDCKDGYLDETSGNTDPSAIEVPASSVHRDVTPLVYVTYNVGNGPASIVSVYMESNDVPRLQKSERIERFNDCDEYHTLYEADSLLLAAP